MSEEKVKFDASGSIDRIELLWLCLNQHHIDRSPFFSDAYSRKTFDTRKKEMLLKAKGGQIRTDIAYDSEINAPIGYCVSIIHADDMGEIESLIVQKEYRGLGIGESLMERAMRWMDEHNVKRKILEVYFGNEDAFTFYERFGFYPKVTVLEQR